MSHLYPPATLALADGTIFKARMIGATKTATAEVVFNTSLTGYQEILTDPSYCGQFVVMTTPHIGNVGINPQDMESAKVWATGFLMREVSRVVSNYRATQPLPNFLKAREIVGLTDLDTRAVVRHLRTCGAMMGAISSDASLSEADLVHLAQTAPSMEGTDLVQKVTCAEPYPWQEAVLDEWQPVNLQKNHPQTSYRVVAYDFGIKYNILRLLTSVGCEVIVVPATTPASEALSLNPDGIFLSNGPGDPAAVSYAIETVKSLLKTDKPIFGICLGHQILALALGGKTHKMKFGHRGGNQPVQVGGTTGPVSITSHNHGFAVIPNSLPPEVVITHLNLNDGCVEGLRHRHKPIFSIQYHPEASPGPHDATGLFNDFINLMQAH